MKTQSLQERGSRARAAATVERLPVGVVVGAVVVMLLWAACFPLIAVGLQSSPPMALAAMRAAFSGLVLLAAARLLRRPPMTGAAAWRGTAVVGFSTTSVGFFGMFYGGLSVSPGIATVVANSQPLIAAVLAAVLLRERLGRAQYVALVTAFAGILLLGGTGTIGFQKGATGALFVLLGAVGVAFGNVALKRLGGRTDAFRAMGWQLLIGSVPLFALTAAMEDWSLIEWDLRLVVSTLSLALIGTALPFVLWFELLGRAPLTQLNGFSFLTPVFGLTIGTLWFDERIAGLQVGGIALSVAGVYLLSRSARLSGRGRWTG